MNYRSIKVFIYIYYYNFLGKVDFLREKKKFYDIWSYFILDIRKVNGIKVIFYLILKYWKYFELDVLKCIYVFLELIVFIDFMVLLIKIKRL